MQKNQALQECSKSRNFSMKHEHGKSVVIAGIYTNYSVNQKSQLCTYVWCRREIATDSCIHNKWSISTAIFGANFFFHMFYFCYYKTWLDLLLWKITSITSGFTSVYLMSCCSFLSLYMKCCFEFMLPMKNLTIRFPQLHKALNNFVNIKYLRNHDTQYIISYWYTFGNCMQSTQSTPPLMPVSRGNNFKTYWTQLFCWR